MQLYPWWPIRVTKGGNCGILTGVNDRANASNLVFTRYLTANGIFFFKDSLFLAPYFEKQINILRLTKGLYIPENLPGIKTEFRKWPYFTLVLYFNLEHALWFCVYLSMVLCLPPKRSEVECNKGISVTLTK